MITRFVDPTGLVNNPTIDGPERAQYRNLCPGKKISELAREENVKTHQLDQVAHAQYTVQPSQCPAQIAIKAERHGLL
jgi:hypothetical protein